MRSEAVHRVLLAELASVRTRLGGGSPRVLDVGGGSGVWAVPLAATGCVVTVLEPSLNALATLKRRAVEAGVADRVTGVQGDTDALGGLIPFESADLVLGHGVLEFVDDVRSSVAALAAAAVPGGAVSVLVANRYAAVLARVLTGRIGDARHLLEDQDGRLGGSDPVVRRFDVDTLTMLLTQAGLTVELLQGDHAVADLVPGSVLEANPGAVDALAELEILAAARPPLRDMATRLHALTRRPNPA